MAPKSRVLVALAFFLAIQATYPNQCDNFYSKVTYALNHCKKAMTATNFEHQMYYAERAWEALENAKSFMDECDCAKTEDKTIDAMETLDKAIEPADWEAGRFFTKKGMAEISELITFIDQCTLGVSTTTTVVADESDPNVPETGSANSMELEMIKVFEKHANDKLQSAEQAIQNLVELSKTIGTTPIGGNDDPNSLSAHQKAYLEKAKKLLETGLKNIGGD
ncbi:hypothetical protein SAMN04487891_10736 [Flagellimonas taeanensis]|uniref:Uncharacterized protein n=1 Tax=Flagellimonas taeanensis TaxID=1005926 RepID=A0A1M6VBH3_9FLAO|nr:hypothetical protein [Allomuricauda taeanensis]SFC19007.1 hypothetical protein SAMN04487891_10736 [Allomuricauda taeanensis]SHK78853.1 hypothetical protein SAMN05216293_1972 [Allomuricauda taeanensis]